MRMVILAWLLAALAPAQQPKLTVQPPLVTGKLIEAMLSPGETHAYPLRLETGTFLRLSTPSRVVYVHVRLIGPDGKSLFELNRDPLLWVSETAGEYRIEVAGDRAQRAAGQYAILLEELRAAVAADHQRLQGQRIHDQANGISMALAESRAQSRKLYDQAREIWHETGEKRLEAHLLVDLSTVEYEAGEVTRVIGLCDEALAIAREAGDRSVEARALGAKGRILSETGRIQEAIQCKRAAIDLYHGLGDRANEGFVLFNLAVNYAQLEQYERSLELGEEWLQFVREAGTVEREIAALANLSIYQMRAGQLEKALATARQGLLLARNHSRAFDEAYILENLGRIYVKMGRAAEALDPFQESLTRWEKFGSRRRQAIARAGLAGALITTGEPGRARDYLQQALLESRAVTDRNTELTALLDLARAERALGNFSGALEGIERAIETAELTRREFAREDLRRSYLATRRDNFAFAIDLLMEMDRKSPGKGFDRQALAMSERARARSLLDYLARSDSYEGVDPELIRKRDRIEADLQSSAEKQLRLISGPHTRAQLETVEKESARLVEELRDARSAIEGTGALAAEPFLGGSEIGPNLLDFRTTLLEYWLGARQSYAWMITSTSVESYQLPGEQEIESAARRVYGEWKQTGGSSAAATRLQQMLLGPFVERLRGRTLAVVADGILHYIPFGALPLPNGAPLLSRFAIAHLPSASALAVVRRKNVGRTLPTKLAAVLADPVYSRDDPRVMGRVTGRGPTAAPRDDLARAIGEAGLVEIDRLQSTRAEAEIIRQLSKGRGLLSAVDFDASRKTVFDAGLADYRILHFAAHGFVSSRFPELSGLILSLVNRNGEAQDGFVQAHEIHRLKLGADLAVLSACQTALGQEVRGEGLVGLTRAFMTAGVPRVVASLWPVADRATAELMRRFYTALLEHHASAADALREAQDSLRREPRWSAPYYWAGFTLQGEWR
jgi:CHAT domain-containing protein/tetratricopeptide (TPR) repeat protein